MARFTLLIFWDIESTLSYLPILGTYLFPIKSVTVYFAFFISPWGVTFSYWMTSILLSRSVMASWYSLWTLMIACWFHMWKHDIAAMLPKDFCFWLLIRKQQPIHPLLIDVPVVLSWVFWLIYQIRCKNKLCRLTLVRVVFWATNVLWNMSSFSDFTIFQCKITVYSVTNNSSPFF